METQLEIMQTKKCAGFFLLRVSKNDQICPRKKKLIGKKFAGENFVRRSSRGARDSGHFWARSARGSRGEKLEKWRAKKILWRRQKKREKRRRDLGGDWTKVGEKRSRTGAERGRLGDAWAQKWNRTCPNKNPTPPDTKFMWRGYLGMGVVHAILHQL